MAFLLKFFQKKDTYKVIKVCHSDHTLSSIEISKLSEDECFSKTFLPEEYHIPQDISVRDLVKIKGETIVKI